MYLDFLRLDIETKSETCRKLKIPPKYSGTIAPKKHFSDHAIPPPPPGDNEYQSDLVGLNEFRRVASTIDDNPDGVSSRDADFRESAISTDFRVSDRPVH